MTSAKAYRPPKNSKYIPSPAIEGSIAQTPNIFATVIAVPQQIAHVNARFRREGELEPCVGSEALLSGLQRRSRVRQDCPNVGSREFHI
jgi:hypothetical protein